ncbi:MAG TPA: peptidyl-prolyl cis-trans isomerase [Opitutaceae bacterium]|nr:peptidyl-prolyl cis-trans isomerase [Opitutaceae bacterium]
MISWIQRYFQRHFRLVFGILLAVTIVSFIFTIGSTPGIGRADRREVVRDYFGHNLASREAMQGLVDDARLSAYLQYGPNVGADQVQSFALQRTAALHFADELHIPNATTSEVTDYIKSLPIFAGPDGHFDVSRYDTFRNGLKSNGFLSEADIARVIGEDARTAMVRQLLSGPGYVLPGDVKSVIVKADTSWTISTATVDYAAYDPGINPTDSEITKFFSDNSFRYTVAPRVSVDYVDFPASAFAVASPPTDAEVRRYYEAHQDRFPKPAPAKVPPVKPDPDADFKAAEPQVRAALQFEKAKRAAVAAASDFAYALYEGKVTRGTALDSFLAGHKTKVASLAPFTRDAGPAELGGSREIANAAFELNADRFYSEGIPSPGGAVVLIWKESFPAHEPLLVDVREKVRADAIDDLKRKRFIDFGRTLKAAIERKIRSGESFEKAAEEARGAVKLAVKSYPPFTYRDQPHDIDQAVIGVLDRLGKGSVSDMAITADKGFLVYAADKKTPPLNESNARFVQVRAQLAMAYARAEAFAVLQEVMDRELKRTDTSLKNALP